MRAALICDAVGSLCPENIRGPARSGEKCFGGPDPTRFCCFYQLRLTLHRSILWLFYSSYIQLSNRIGTYSGTYNMYCLSQTTAFGHERHGRKDDLELLHDIHQPDPLCRRPKGSKLNLHPQIQVIVLMLRSCETQGCWFSPKGPCTHIVYILWP